ncbi:phytanoyl-CoA dioxygenase family protein [Amycolatopsis sp. NPDC059090]|uniref:phytanoyl-CoA dioxygenase family protein n=1 Tax=unclassified Amycolatopsis TaxID=2618356 RepID=UPI0036729E4E
MTGRIAEAFRRDGFYFPVPLITETEASALAAEVRRYEAITRKAGGRLGRRWNSPKIHLLAPWADKLVRDERILAVVEDLIGPDLLVWSTHLFWRRGRSSDELAWHQDALHYGWEGFQHRTVRIWLALTETTRVNGTMRFARGPHNQTLVPHRRSSSAKGIFRGLEVDLDIDHDTVVDVLLRPGEGSLHHGSAVHSSGPSSTDADRICFAVDYITPEVKPKPGPDTAMLVRGRDTTGFYLLDEPPSQEFAPEAIRRFNWSVEVRDRRFLAVMGREA